MKQMLPKELEQLLCQYNNANSSLDLQIKAKLEKIADCYSECTSEEKAFTDVITVLFCRTICLIKDQMQQQEQATNIPWDTETVSDRFMSYQQTHICDDLPFPDGDALRIAFYNYFRNEQKKKKDAEKTEYPEIRELSDFKSARINPTIRDYTARIQTFTNGYMQALPQVMEIWHRENEHARVDDILFVYRHIELILASFDTKEISINNEIVVSKQKNNIRSALRKLNEFKQKQLNG